LLVILFAEDCEIRPYLREKLADDGRDPAEEMRTKTIFQTCGCRTFRHDARGEAIRIHRLDVGIPDQIDTLRRQLRHVGFPRARIGGEVFTRRKLRRIDEDRNNHLRRAPLCQPHQRHMSVMERTHGRDQRDAGLSRA